MFLKKISTIVLALLLLATLTSCGQPEPSPTPIPTIPPSPAPTAKPTPEPTYPVWADRDNVNVRFSPSEGAQLLATVPFSTKFEALGRATASDWTRIAWDTETGEAYVLTTNISQEKRAYSAIPDNLYIIGVINTDNANLRAGPTLDYPFAEPNGIKLKGLSKGNEFRILGFANQFARIQYSSDFICWAANGFRRDKVVRDIIDIVAWTTDNVNLREGPSAQSGRKTELKEGTKFHICGYENGYFKIVLAEPIGKIEGGWMDARFVSQTPPE